MVGFNWKSANKVRRIADNSQIDAPRFDVETLKQRLAEKNVVHRPYRPGLLNHAYSGTIARYNMAAIEKFRFDLALENLNKPTPNYEAVFASHNPSLDKNNPFWSLLISFVYGQDSYFVSANKEAEKVFLSLVDELAKEGPLPKEWINFLLEIKGFESFSCAVTETYPESPVGDRLLPLREKGDHLKYFLYAIFNIHNSKRSLLIANQCRDSDEYLDKFYDLQGVSTKNGDHRRKLRNIYYEKRQWDAYLMCINPWIDLDNPITLSRVAHCFGDQNTGLYNAGVEEKIHYFNILRFAEYENDCASSAFALGHSFNGGYNARVDFNAAVFWFEVAMELGHGAAPYFVRQILMSEDERAEQGDPELQKYLDSLIERIEEMGHPCARNWLIMVYAYGYGKWNDQERIVDHYESLVPKDAFCAPPQLKSLFAYTLRSAVLGNTPHNTQELLQCVMDKIESKNLNKFYESELLIPLTHFKTILTDGALDPKYAESVENTLNVTRQFYAQAITVEELQDQLGFASDWQFVERAHDKTMLEGLRDGLWITRELAKQENWYIHPFVFYAFESANAESLGLNITEMKKSALIMGPFYNPLDANTALPILGQWLPASSSFQEEEQQKCETGHYVPQPGISQVVGLTATQNGEIEFNCRFDETAPAMVVPEDLAVAIALAFGSPKDIIWPSLSLEQKVESLLDDRYKTFLAKVWSPLWLGHTDFGRTLYIVDELTGGVTWSPRLFAISDPATAFDTDFPSYIKHLIEDLRFTGGVDKSTQGARICVVPEHIPLAIEKRRDAQGKELWQVTIRDVKMRINGAYTHEIDGVEDRSIAENDVRFGQGRLVQRLTDHYRDIALAMPVFERARQLMGLFYALVKLRQEGYQIGAKAQQEASAFLAQMQAREPLSRSELVIKALPFRLDFLN